MFLGSNKSCLAQSALAYKREDLFYTWCLHNMREDKRKKERFDSTNLMELPEYHAVVKIVTHGRPQQPVSGKLDLSEWDNKRWERKMFGIKDKLSKKHKIKKDKLEIDMPANDTRADKLDIIIDKDVEDDDAGIEDSFFNVMGIK